MSYAGGTVPQTKKQCYHYYGSKYNLKRHNLLKMLQQKIHIKMKIECEEEKKKEEDIYKDRKLYCT